MSTPDPPSEAWLKGVTLEVLDWTWGLVQGSFNEKQELSQIIVDAVIGMIPLVGDVTAARDLIAIVLGMVNEPKKRKDPVEWIMLVILGFALIPVVGGVLKGVGRLLLRSMDQLADATALAVKSRVTHEATKDIVALLNRIGSGNAERWLRELRLVKYQTDVTQKLVHMLVTIRKALLAKLALIAKVIPEDLKKRVEAVCKMLKELESLAASMVPEALKKLDGQLREIQAYLIGGGKNTSRVVAHDVQANRPTVTYADELEILEGQGAELSRRGGWKANAASVETKDYLTVYEPKEGYPNLLERKTASKPGAETHEFIATFSGKISNRELKPGSKIYRVFGTKGSVIHPESGYKGEMLFGEFVGDNFAAGFPLAENSAPSFWGIGEPPTSAKQWRETAAVLDSWNRNGYIAVGTIMDSPAGGLKAVTGKVAEQFDKNTGQYLAGGATQGLIRIEHSTSVALHELSQSVATHRKPVTRVIGNISWEIKPTQWEDVSGVHGYIRPPGRKTVATSRLAAGEYRRKVQDD